MREKDMGGTTGVWKERRRNEGRNGGGRKWDGEADWIELSYEAHNRVPKKSLTSASGLDLSSGPLRVASLLEKLHKGGCSCRGCHICS